MSDSKATKDYVLGYMSSHSGLAAHKNMGNNAKQQRKLQLAKLSQDIEKNCHVHKTATQIEYIWKKAKKDARSYNAAKKMHHLKTGNPTNDLFVVNEEHEKVLEILGSSHNNGLELVSEAGIHKETFANPSNEACVKMHNPVKKRNLLSVSDRNVLPASKYLRLRNNHRVVYDVNSDGTALENKSLNLENSNARLPLQEILQNDNMKLPSVPVNSVIAKENVKSNLSLQEILQNDKIKLPSISINSVIAKENLISANQLIQKLQSQTAINNAQSDKKNTNVLSLKRQNTMNQNKPQYIMIQSSGQSVLKHFLATNSSVAVSNLDQKLNTRQSKVSQSTQERSRDSMTHSQAYTRYSTSYNRKLSTSNALQEYAGTMKGISVSLAELAAAKREKNNILKQYYDNKLKIQQVRLHNKDSTE